MASAQTAPTACFGMPLPQAAAAPATLTSTDCSASPAAEAWSSTTATIAAHVPRIKYGTTPTASLYALLL